MLCDIATIKRMNRYHIADCTYILHHSFGSLCKKRSYLSSPCPIQTSSSCPLHPSATSNPLENALVCPDVLNLLHDTLSRCCILLLPIRGAQFNVVTADYHINLPSDNILFIFIIAVTEILMSPSKGSSAFHQIEELPLFG